MFLRIDVDVRGAETLKRKLLERAKDLSPVMRTMEAQIRRGPGSIADQIARRAYFAEDGSVRPWQEPSILPAGASAHPRVRAGEEIMWRAARGESAASISRSGPRFALVGVNDLLVRQEAARLGNQIVSSASYFGFVTGDFSKRTSAAPALPAKPIARRPGQKRTGRGGGPKPENLTRYTVQYAMWWFLGYTHGIWLTEAQLRAGIMTPPKNIGWNPVLLERIRDRVADYIVGASDFTERGRANDPRRAA